MYVCAKVLVLHDDDAVGRSAQIRRDNAVRRSAQTRARVSSVQATSSTPTGGPSTCFFVVKREAQTAALQIDYLITKCATYYDIHSTPFNTLVSLYYKNRHTVRFIQIQTLQSTWYIFQDLLVKQTWSTF